MRAYHSVIITRLCVVLQTVIAFYTLFGAEGVNCEMTGLLKLSARGAHTCAVTTSGGAKCWGYNSYGQLGGGSTEQRTTPGDVSGLTLGVSYIAAGGNHTCAVTTSGGAKCWGHNPSGQLGDGSTTQSTSSVDVLGLTSGISSLAAGYAYTCAVTTSGGAKCWGFNSSGQLGDGSTTQRTTAVNVSGLTSGISSLAAAF